MRRTDLDTNDHSGDFSPGDAMRVDASGVEMRAVGPDSGSTPTRLPDYVDLFERAPAGYMLSDDSGCIVKINRAGAGMLGWNAAWLRGKPFSRWVARSDRHLFELHRAELRAGAGSVIPELRIKNRQGRLVSLRLESIRLASCDAHDNSSAIVRSIMIDVSGEEQSARKLRHLQSQLAHLARLNTAGEMASSLAHELNQPLGTVMLNCEAALRLLDENAAGKFEFAEALIQAREAASFASGVVRHLRSFLRNNEELQTVCELPALIQDVSTLMRADARDNDIELQFDIEPRLPSVRVDSVQVEQVLLNLAHNSIEAMRENGGGHKRVTIKARTEAQNRIRVSVTDTGPGLDANQLEHLFTPFCTTKRDGMGMGLSISRTIIEAHGGQLWADEGRDPGATIHFTLPAIDDASHAD